jgi:hypothetical protein
MVSPDRIMSSVPLIIVLKILLHSDLKKDAVNKFGIKD